MRTVPSPAGGRRLAALLAAALLVLCVAAALVPRVPRGLEPAEAAPAGPLDGAESILARLPLERVRALAAGAVRDGLRRLDDADLLDRLALERKVLESADPATCAAIARGSAEPLGVLRSLRGLGPADLVAWCGIAERAVAAAATRLPAPEVSAEEFDAAWEALRASLGPADAARLDRAMDDLARAPDAEAAWAVRRLYAGVLSLPEPQGAVLARKMVEGGARP